MISRRRAEDAVRGLLAEADIIIGGRRPWDVRVHNEELFARVLAGGSLAAGDAYVDGWWDVERLDQFFHRLFLTDLDARLTRSWRMKVDLLLARLFNRQSLGRARHVVDAHYNLGNDVFQAMLGKRMAYTCAYWNGAGDLDEAEEAKLELVCRKLELRPGMTVLEYGCGWGAFAKYAAERHGAAVLGVNIAEEQVKLGRELCRGLPVELLVEDYRNIRGRFDRVISMGIMEHVGPKNYRTYMESAARCLKDDGIAFIHTIARNDSALVCDPWFDRRIFPNGATPSLRQLSHAAEGLFVVEDAHNIGPQYDPTLLAWHDNLTRGWHALREKYGERFYRTMKYYLLSSAGAFRSRRAQVFQLVMTKPGRVQPRCRMEPTAAAPRLSLDAAAP
ncbi:MAG: cyclopropane fatty acyl phospholipid synthase [Elusimicrobia bacterium]|nr:cyclopropane fatty acyl phospholipid synthase [Elusimicrobiota bacterium]